MASEIATRSNRIPHSLEVARRYGSHPHSVPSSVLFKIGAFSHQQGAGVVKVQRKIMGKGSRMDARHHPHTIQDLLAERQATSGIVAVQIEVIRHHDQFVGVEANIDGVRISEAFDEQPRTDQQDQAKRHFSNN